MKVTGIIIAQIHRGTVWSSGHLLVNQNCLDFGSIEILTTDHTSCFLASIPEGKRMSKSETHISFLLNLLEK